MGGILFERNKALALLESLESSKDLIAGTTIHCLLFTRAGFISLSHLRHVTVSLSPRFSLGLLEHREVWREADLVHDHTICRHAAQSPPNVFIYLCGDVTP